MVFSNEQQKNIILDSIADGVFTIDSEWRITSFNKAAENITSINKNEAIGRHCWEVFRASICEESCALRKTMETGNQIINESIFIVSSEGEKVPADLELVESFSLRVDEAVLTGESVPVNKQVSKGKEGKVFKGTLIAAGRAKAKVIATGMNTEFGKIVHLVAKQEKTRSPLAIQLDNLGKRVGLVILGLIAILFILGNN